MIRNTRFFPGFCILLFIILFTAGVMADEGSPQPVKVVIDYNYPPYSFLDNNGNLQGISIDLWRLFEKKTGIPVNITGVAWGDAQARVLSGEFDVIDTMGYSDERAKLYDFLPAYSHIEVPIFFSRDIQGISGPGSLQGFVVGVQAGDSVIDVLQSHNVTQLKDYPTYEDLILDAKAGNIRVFSMDYPAATYLLNKYNMVEEFRRTAPLYSTDVHRAVRKGSPLYPLLENGFSRITPAESRAIEDKWLGTPIISSDAIRFLSIFLVTFCILVIGLGIWIFVLRRSITAHTRTLTEELIRREHAEKELARANRTLQLFGILLQEELKSNIFALRGYLTLISPDRSDPRNEEMLGKCRQISSSMEELVETVRYMRSIGDRRQEWIPVSSTFTYARSHHTVTGIEFDERTGDLEIFTQPVFETIFSILISSSLRNGKTITKISLSWEPRDDAIILVYEDDGVGIPDGRKPGIFTRPEEGGTGHRLAVLHEILRMLDMGIVENGQEGSGVRFEIRIPRERYRVTPATTHGNNSD